MNWIIEFDIDNNQKEYAACLRMIDIIENRCSPEQEDYALFEKVRYKSVDCKPILSDIAAENFVSYTECPLVIGERDIYWFLFRVNCADTDDIINLIYYCLVNDRIDSKGILCIKCNNKQKNNIKDLLADVLMSGVIREYYTLVGDEYERITSDKARKIKRFSPIFRISSTSKTQESVNFWRQSVQTFLRDLYQKIPLIKSENRYAVDYFLPHIVPSIIKSKYPGDIWPARARCREIKLINSCVECFCSIEKSRDENFVECRYTRWRSQKLFDMIKHMPLLAMYIFCLSDYYQKDAANDSWEDIEQEIFDARDVAEGLLQILENIYHSEYQTGYFCFRVHQNVPDHSGEYLKKEYREYMKSWSGNDKQPLNYLEIKVADFSHRTIVVQFNETIIERMQKANEEEKKVYREISDEAGRLSLSSFYGENTRFWQQYNSLSENVIHHYGIQIFQSLIECYHGCFRVRSGSTYMPNPDKDFYSTLKEQLENTYAIPGTQYDALIPLGKQDMMQNISMDVNLKYDNHLIEEYEACPINLKFNAETIKTVLVGAGENLSFQDKKEFSIHSMEKLFEEAAERHIGKAIESKKCVLHICAKDISIIATEVFCKVLMLYIARKGQDRDCYIMITECSQAHFVELARMMALFYNKQGFNPLMGRTQIFMSGDDEGEEFLITGTNLEKAVAGTEKLAFARSVHPNCLGVLRKSLKNHMVTGEVSPNDVISIVPFDMISYPGSDRTLMERRLKKVLEQDVQSEKFGCRLENLHVRIGSKIHIRTFYEAELLFHNNYYTLRFAYWLYNELNLDTRLQKDRPFVLVGYENYSEMLINELCDMFKKGMGISPEYIIYEEGTVGKFRGGNELSKYKDAQFVVIVPINSTTTTHIKTAGFLEKSIRSSLGNRVEYSLNRENVLNYGIVLIASTDKNMYWDRCGDKNTIKSAIDGKTLKYYIEVESEWNSPLKCRACFPESDYTQEQPLVETNKESVVPMHAISIRRPYLGSRQWAGAAKTAADTEELKRLRELSDILVYRHVERNGNHFNYYFATERLWEKKEIKGHVETWLRKQANNLFGKKGHKVYDIIVAPLHYSNTVFVEEVNNCLFSNAALVLHFDADREFRMNVTAKYSSVQQLYDNLHKRNEKAEINFHYIDDTIVSGRTYQRMKSLIGSLISPEAVSTVEINIFKSVVLLLNRMSRASMKDYIDDPNYFMAYFNLGISSMRVNSDACILCKKYNEWSKLSEQASLNEIYTFWQKKSNHIVCTSIEKLDFPNGHSLKGANHVEHPERAIQYMIASHRAKILLDEICAYENVDQIIKDIVEELFPESVYPLPDELIAMLKILCRPFMTFRREEREAVFKLMLMMLDALLKNQCPDGGDKLGRLLYEIYSDNNIHVKIVQMLINRLAELESNALIRKCNMERILAFAGEYREGDEYKEFTSNYLNRIKQLTGQGKDFTKGLYLEYILLYGKEYSGINDSDMNMSILTEESREAYFYRKLYLENTKLANYGIEYLADCFWSIKEYTQDNMKEILNNNYYFDNFIQYLAFHKVVIMDEKVRVESFTSKAEFDKLVGMVRFELFYQRIFGRKKISGLEDAGLEDEVCADKGTGEMRHNIQDKFVEMIEYLKAASGALDGEIIVPYQKDNEYTDGSPKYIALNMGKGSAIRALENDEQDLLNFMREDREFEGDTYAICRHGGKGKWILFKFYDKTGAGNSAMVIYMLFPFETEDKGELLHAVKNILIFRRKIWNIFNLSSDALLQSLSDNLFYKQQMLKSRSVGHMEFSESLDQLEYVCGIVNDDAYIDKSGNNRELITKYFELVVNNLIGFMNAQLLGGKGTEYTDPCPPEICFDFFWKKYDYVFKALARVWKMTIHLDDTHKGDCHIRPIEAKDKMIPSQKVLLIMFLAVFQNIRKHCETDDREIECSVHIEQSVFADGERPCLCIKNRILAEEEQYIEEIISPRAYRVTNGISLAVIFDICRAYYPRTKYSDIFCVPEKEQEGKQHENSGKDLEFVVKLPILL